MSVDAAAAGVDEADVLRQTNGHLLVCYPTREGWSDFVPILHLHVAEIF